MDDTVEVAVTVVDAGTVVVTVEVVVVTTGVAGLAFLWGAPPPLFRRLSLPAMIGPLVLWSSLVKGWTETERKRDQILV